MQKVVTMLFYFLQVIQEELAVQKKQEGLLQKKLEETDSVVAQLSESARRAS